MMTIGHTSLSTNDSLGHTGLYSAGATHPASDWIARYEFANGAFATDETGNYNLTNNGASSLNDGTRGYVSSFDGVNDSMSGIPALSESVDKTYMFWFNADVIENVFGSWNGGDASQNARNWVHLQSTTNIRISSTFGTTQNHTIPAVSTGTWYHLAIQQTTDGINYTTIFFNGVESVSGRQNNGLKWDTISGYQDANFTWDGLLDNFTVYDRALTSSEITDIYDYEVL
jgi:hypothetical protein